MPSLVHTASNKLYQSFLLFLGKEKGEVDGKSTEGKGEEEIDTEVNSKQCRRPNKFLLDRH